MNAIAKINEAPAPSTQTQPALLMQETVYALTRWDQGKPHFATIDGQWTPNMADAYTLPQAQDFNWFAPNQQDKRRASAITFSIYDRDFIAPPIAAVPGPETPTVHIQRQDHVIIAHAFDAAARLIKSAKTLAVCMPSVRREDGQYILSDQRLARAVVCYPVRPTADIVSRIDKHAAPAPVSWHHSKFIGYAAKPRLISIQPI